MAEQLCRGWAAGRGQEAPAGPFPAPRTVSQPPLARRRQLGCRGRPATARESEPREPREGAPVALQGRAGVWRRLASAIGSPGSGSGRIRLPAAAGGEGGSLAKEDGVCLSLERRSGRGGRCLSLPLSTPLSPTWSAWRLQKRGRRERHPGGLAGGAFRAWDAPANGFLVGVRFAQGKEDAGSALPACLPASAFALPAFPAPLRGHPAANRRLGGTGGAAGQRSCHRAGTERRPLGRQGMY